MTIHTGLHPMPWLAAALGLLCLAGCTSAADSHTENADAQPARVAIRSVLNAQVAAWNDGSIEGFMQGYARSDSLRFASGGEVQYGWNQTFERYQAAYVNEEVMGRLALSDLDIRMVGLDHAVVFGRWELSRSDSLGNVGGLFTLVFEEGREGWKIVHDHTSARPAAATADTTREQQVTE